MGKLKTKTAGSRLAIVLTTVIVTTVVLAGGVALATVGFNSVGSPQIKNGSIQSVDIATGGVKTVDIANGTVSSADIRNNAVRGLDIRDGTIRSADIADGAVRAVDLDVPVIHGLYVIEGPQSVLSTSSGERLFSAASCDPGDFATGGGARASWTGAADGSQKPIIDETYPLRPSTDPTGWGVSALSLAADYRVTAHVICADMTP